MNGCVSSAVSSIDGRYPRRGDPTPRSTDRAGYELKISRYDLGVDIELYGASWQRRARASNHGRPHRLSLTDARGITLMPLESEFAADALRYRYVGG